MTTLNETDASVFADDQIIAEVRATRRRLLQEHGGAAGLASFLRRAEQQSNRSHSEKLIGAGQQTTSSDEGWQGIVGSQQDNPLFDEVIAVIQAERAAEKAAMALIRASNFKNNPTTP